MRVSSVYSSSALPPQLSARPSAAAHSPAPAVFQPFCAQAFSEARARRVPVFLLIGEISDAFSDPSLSLLLRERTVPVHLPVGARPDVELLCQRAGALFSGEGALPLCALLLDDVRPFLAAPLPPAGYPIDPARLYVWLSQADRRFSQNLAGMQAQAAQVIHSFQPDRLKKAYAPPDAAHDLLRALLTAQDTLNGGFGQIKSPLCPALRFLQHASGHGDRQAYGMLQKALDAMLASPIYDPLDGAFFRSTLTEDWLAFVPQKPLGVNAMLALILLDSGRRSEAMRILDFMVSGFLLEGGALASTLYAPKDTYAFTPEQACAALGSEDGLRACRLLGLLHQHASAEPRVTPSRFSPVLEAPSTQSLDSERPALYPVLSKPPAPEDAAFLRRALPVLLRARCARTPQRPSLPIIAEHTALAAAILAQCAQKLGEQSYIHAARRAVSFLLDHTPASAGLCPLPVSCIPCSPLHNQATCGASAALALALLTLGQNDEEYAQNGLRLLGSALHAFVRPDGLVMHTPKEVSSYFPRVPALYDGELPSAAALLVHALRIANGLRPQAHYGDAIETIWLAAAPAVHRQPLAFASLIDAAFSR